MYAAVIVELCLYISDKWYIFSCDDDDYDEDDDEDGNGARTGH